MTDDVKKWVEDLNPSDFKQQKAKDLAKKFLLEEDAPQQLVEKFRVIEEISGGKKNDDIFRHIIFELIDILQNGDSVAGVSFSESLPDMAYNLQASMSDLSEDIPLNKEQKLILSLGNEIMENISGVYEFKKEKLSKKIAKLNSEGIPFVVKLEEIDFDFDKHNNIEMLSEAYDHLSLEDKTKKAKEWAIKDGKEAINNALHFLELDDNRNNIVLEGLQELSKGVKQVVDAFNREQKVEKKIER